MNKQITLNTKNMPPYLSAQRFDRWVGEFHLDGISVTIPSLTVSFSMEEKRDTYGCFSLGEAKKRIRELILPKKEAREWFEDLLGGIETREELRENAEGLAECAKIGKGLDRKEIVMRIKEIAAAVQFTRVRLGEYRHEGREIVLFARNIEQSYRGKNVEEAFEETFCHELFHAVHYEYLRAANGDADILCRTDATRTVVLESLASYYENGYCKRHGISTDLEAVWEKNEPAVYPYAGARAIRDDLEFNEILTASRDLDAALRKLLFKEERECRQFYMIKNGTMVEECKLVRFGKAAPCPQSQIEAVIEYCRNFLGAQVSLRSNHYSNTTIMREFFLRHGEEIGDKMRIVCQNEGGEIVIFLEMQGTRCGSQPLDLLCSDSRFRKLCPRPRTAASFSAIRRVKIIGLDALTDSAGAPMPLSAVAPKIQANLREFQNKLFELENILNSL